MGRNTRSLRKVKAVVTRNRILSLVFLACVSTYGQSTAAQNPPVRVSGGVMMGLAFKKVQPQAQPRPEHPFSGVVVLRIIVGADGTVESAEVISGSVPLRDTAIQAARQWLFKPYLVDGAPVRVETTLTFIHVLGEQPGHD